MLQVTGSTKRPHGLVWYGSIPSVSRSWRTSWLRSVGQVWHQFKVMSIPIWWLSNCELGSQCAGVACRSFRLRIVQGLRSACYLVQWVVSSEFIPVDLKSTVLCMRNPTKSLSLRLGVFLELTRMWKSWALFGRSPSGNSFGIMSRYSSSTGKNTASDEKLLAKSLVCRIDAKTKNNFWRSFVMEFKGYFLGVFRFVCNESVFLAKSSYDYFLRKEMFLRTMSWKLLPAGDCLG